MGVAFNNKSIMTLRKAPPNIILNDSMCLVHYYDTFDGKIRYCLKDENPQTLRVAYATTINIEKHEKI